MNLELVKILNIKSLHIQILFSLNDTSYTTHVKLIEIFPYIFFSNIKKLQLMNSMFSLKHSQFF